MSRDSTEGLGALIELAIYLAIAFCVAIITVFVGVHLLCGLVFNLGVRLLAAAAYRLKPGPAWRVLCGVLALGALLLGILWLAPLYPSPSLFLAAVGSAIALAGYYGANWGVRMPFRSEVVMRAQEEILRARFRMWALVMRYRLRISRLVVLNWAGLSRC